MNIVLSNESREYGGYPGDQFRKGRAQLSLRVPAFQHHLVPVSERTQCCEDSEGKHCAKVKNIRAAEDAAGILTYKGSGQYSGCRSLLPCNK